MAQPKEASLWNTPLQEYEVKTFFDSYMPWAKATAYAHRKQLERLGSLATNNEAGAIS